MCSPQESTNFTRKFSCQNAAQDGRAYNKRETISAWKTVLRCLTGRPWSRNLFVTNMRCSKRAETRLRESINWKISADPLTPECPDIKRSKRNNNERGD